MGLALLTPCWIEVEAPKTRIVTICMILANKLKDFRFRCLHLIDNLFGLNSMGLTFLNLVFLTP